MNDRSQSGNALFIILIAVSLLGALSYAVTQSNRGGLSALTEEKARVYALEVLEYGQVMVNAVAQLRLRGCYEEEISFENSVVSGYTNANAPSDQTCHVFYPAGGGMNWNTPQDNITVGTATASSWRINALNAIDQVGTTGSNSSNVELVFFLDDIKESICLQINDRMAISNAGNAPPTDTLADVTGGFTGSFVYSYTIGDENDSLGAKPTGCFQNTAANKFVFYKVLRAR